MAAFNQLPKHTHPDFIGIRKKPGGGVQIDKVHPLAKGLHGAWLFNTPGAVRDIVGDLHATVGGNATTKGTENGLVYTFDGADDYLDASPNYNINNAVPTQFTMIARARRNGAGSTFQAVFTKGELSVDANGLCGFWFHSTNGLHWRVGSAPNLFHGSYTDGVFTTVAITFDGSTGAIYQDGVGLATTASAVSSSAAKTLAFGGLCFNLTADDLNGEIEFAYLYDRPLSAAEIAEISKNPYQILKPAIQNQAIIVSASAGQTVAVGLATETNTSLAATKDKAKAIGIASETNTALALSTAIEKAVGLASETNAAYPLAATKAKAVGLLTETNAALSTTAAKALSTGQAIDVNTAIAIAASKAKAVNLATETNAAFALASAKAKSTGLATETNTAFSVTAITPGGASVGIATETNTALNLTAAKSKAVGLATETNTSLEVTLAKAATVGQASTLDSAAQLAILKSLSVGLAQTTDTALPLSIAQVVAVGLASETDTALPLSVGFPLASWVYTVAAEQRIITVSAEQRSYTVAAESRRIEVST